MQTNLSQAGLNRLVGRLSREFYVPSLSVAVWHGGEAYYSSVGMIDKEARVAADETSVYAIASASKAFIATSVLMLVQRGVLNLDDPVKKYMPDFKMFDPYMTEHLTIRDALSHRSGLPRHDLTRMNNVDCTVYDTVRMIEHLPPAFEPRTRFHYQNHMFALMTVLVDRFGGMPWTDFLKKNIFEPLDMRDTYATGHMIKDENPRKARPYKNGAAGEHVRMPYLLLVNGGCTGSIFSSTRDLLKWARYHLNGDGRLVRRPLLDQMHRPQMIIRTGELSPTDLSPEVDLTAYGLAWFIESYRGRKLVHHGGTTNGFKSIVGFAPQDDIAFAVLTNLNQSQAPQATAYSICDLILGLEPVDWHKKISGELKKQAAENDRQMQALQKLVRENEGPFDPLAYEGDYVHPAYGVFRFVCEGGALVFKAFGQRIAVKNVGGEHFVLDPGTPLGAPHLHGPFYFERMPNNGPVCAAHLRPEVMLKEPLRFERV